MYDTEKYNDIINLPHHRSRTHHQMSVGDRAAQFSPFAALKGYEDEIDDLASPRLSHFTQSEAQISQLNEMLVLLKGREKEHPDVFVTCFRSETDDGEGVLLTLKGKLTKVDGRFKLLVLGGEKIRFDEIAEIHLSD